MAAGLVALLVLRVYVVQESLAALVLFSVGCPALAFLGLALFLLDALGQTLLFKLRGAILAWTIFAHRLPVIRDGLDASFRWSFVGVKRHSVLSVSGKE